MRIARPLLDQIVAHARRDAPNECFGAVATRGDAATRIYELTNVAASPFRFDSGFDFAQAQFDIDEHGDELGAIYHSHTRSAPYPSQTDINFAGQYPDAVWIIVGLEGDEPLVQAYRIDGGEVAEEPLEA